ncbi:MAG: hypothetical protein UR25_C0003G0049 [Candidatus Nomurabacteria bacterium GW2011_GWE1_32_28]|uniref:CDP-archaeol synthase n=1 Tax=Candidatus Nomurabacteria bacterium GW2011_GWF1_31_48 TaxID=1618767 RepID=A0A0F9YUW7_9BACT|nr:MAG: hypothetical protein UR10_C0003G0049 [Candidatus Nomurabacteria bacterium GW2011_GWF2_30_133]KKP28689.1 MAG: hypothetical protein UR18_C0002G0101 [Candidatus Nomurabacteria bacterium GW2011_GWE2_31_40]KKP30266.1 MAG: hypothetical protein UR19_C0003G0102 [Candidatus Nomurabacteria bacterium GW2011_GWF1_31_48]KKP34793.1 MAG: hypothetical protein UR25_C0003G0049 [Candidatus Nomurabacteria bacterium GW2011_GWE1_32_28]HAS80749.1 hypothetical protein [Candidatus Nomurabacteria bacterium]
MIPTTINNFIIYSVLIWGTNMLLNVLGTIKLHFPSTKKYDKPIDARIEYKGDRLIGESTTIVGLIVCIMISIILYFVGFDFKWVIIPFLVYTGHTLGSIIKRRMHKKGGEFVPFIDHGDYTITTGIIFIALGYITPIFAILSISLTYIFHPIMCYLAYKIKLRERPY